MRAAGHDVFFDQFPQASSHFVVVEDLARLGGDVLEDLRRQARATVEQVASSGVELATLSPFAEWRTAYRGFRVQPAKYRSSVEQLVRRALRGDSTYTAVPAVEASCQVSVAALSPMGGYDLDALEGDITLRLSEAGEKCLLIGAAEPFDSPPGVVVYADRAGIVCWAWNHRDATRTALRPDSARALFMADSVSSVTRPRAEQAIARLAEAFERAGCVTSAIATLDATRRDVQL